MHTSGRAKIFYIIFGEIKKILNCEQNIDSCLVDQVKREDLEGVGAAGPTPHVDSGVLPGQLRQENSDIR